MVRMFRKLSAMRGFGVPVFNVSCFVNNERVLSSFGNSVHYGLLIAYPVAISG